MSSARKSPRRRSAKSIDRASRWDVELTRDFELPGFLWKPGRMHRVSGRVLALMRLKRGLVARATPA